VPARGAPSTMTWGRPARSPAGTYRNRARSARGSATRGRQGVDPPGEVEVQTRDATLGVRRQPQGHHTPPDVDVGVVVHLLGQRSHCVHVGEGVGEVLAVHELDRVFGLLGHPILVKRGSLLSLDDAKNNNLIFLGSPAENLTLREIPSTQEFVFQRLTSGPRKGDLAILNVHPQAAEPNEFLASPSKMPLTEEYAVIARVREGNPSQSVMILAGTTTIGTQAAVEYICSPSSLDDLLQRLGVSRRVDMKPFEAVLRVKVTRGVPVTMELVALRKAS